MYVDKHTGEVKEFQHHASRAEDKASVSQSLRKLRDLINANLEDPETALWATLTYRENMTDPARLYEDYRRFWQRFKYYLSKQGRNQGGKVESIPARLQSVPMFPRSEETISITDEGGMLRNIINYRTYTRLAESNNKTSTKTEQEIK